MHTDKPSVPEPSFFVVKTATENLERYKSPGTDQIMAELTCNMICEDGYIHARLMKLYFFTLTLLSKYHKALLTRMSKNVGNNSILKPLL
jgi:hypothetical protein